jgi:dephospho-CoA kinase
LRLIVSGGISSGKSTVVGLMARLGALVIEADRIGHDVLAPDGAAFGPVASRWPSVVRDGEIDRGLLAAIVFRDTEQLDELEAISHPLIRAEIARRVAAAPHRDIVLELPLASDLVGAGWTRIVVDAPDDLRMRRAVERGMAGDDVAGRMAAQPDRQRWATLADIVIDNSGTREDLEAEVHRVWATLADGPSA